MEIHLKLKQLRKLKHLTQEEVAAMLNVTRQAVSNWEVGKTSPDLDTLVSLAKLYDVSIDAFFSSEEVKVEGADEVISKKKLDEKSSTSKFGKKKFQKNFRKYIDTLPFAGFFVSVVLWMLVKNGTKAISIQGYFYIALPFLINLLIYLPVNKIIKESEKNEK